MKHCRYTDIKVSPKIQHMMWFAGIRGGALLYKSVCRHVCMRLSSHSEREAHHNQPAPLYKQTQTTKLGIAMAFACSKGVSPFVHFQAAFRSNRVPHPLTQPTETVPRYLREPVRRRDDHHDYRPHHALRIRDHHHPHARVSGHPGTSVHMYLIHIPKPNSQANHTQPQTHTPP